MPIVFVPGVRLRAGRRRDAPEGPLADQSVRGPARVGRLQGVPKELRRQPNGKPGKEKGDGDCPIDYL